MMYNTDIRNGAHVVFFRENCPKIRENDERLYKEAQYVHDVATYLHDNLEGIYERQDLSDFNRKKYNCLLYTSPSPRDRQKSRMPSSA